MLAPFIESIALRDSSSVLISINPKPLLRPVSRSMMIWALVTVPWGSNICRSSSSVVEKGRLPT
jgi:hypothetical protein